MGIILIIRQHHGEPVPQGKVIPREVKAFAALVRPDRADARPDLLTLFVFARIPAVIEDIRWCVWHRNAVSATAFSVGDWQGVSTRGDAVQRHQRAKEKNLRGHGHARAASPVCMQHQQRIKKGPYERPGENRVRPQATSEKMQAHHPACEFVAFLKTLRRPCADFFPSGRRSRHGRGSNPAVCGPKKRCNILRWK